MEKCKFCQEELAENSTVCPSCGKDNAAECAEETVEETVAVTEETAEAAEETAAPAEEQAAETETEAETETNVDVLYGEEPEKKGCKAAFAAPVAMIALIAFAFVSKKKK